MIPNLRTYDVRVANARAADAEVDALEWFDSPDVKIGFRGLLAGIPRTIVGETKEQLLELARKMADGRA